MKTIIIIQIGLLVLSCLHSFGQRITTSGKEFFVSFYRNVSSNGPNEIKLFLTSSVSTSGTIINPNTSYNQPFTIAAGTVTQVTVPLEEAYNIISGTVSNLGLIITAEDTFSAYAFSSRPYSSDASTIIQSGALGTDYLIASYNGLGDFNYPSCFLIEASEDNTNIQITPSVITENDNPAGVPFSITLNKGQTYYVTTKANLSSDLSGSWVSVTNGCKPIAVFAGAKSRVPIEYSAADILYEQLFPISSFGKQFITGTLKGRNVYRARVYAAYDNTAINIDGALAATINAGSLYEFESNNEPKYITTNKPVQVVLFATSHEYDIMRGPDNDGDPTMITIPPIEQKLKESIFLSPESGSIRDHKVSIVCKTADANKTELDGINVGNSFVAVPGNPVYSQAAFDISAGQHKIVNSNGFIAYAYGFGSYQGYGYCTGSSVENINTYFTCNNISSIGNPTVDVCIGNTDFNIITSGSNSSYTWDFGDGTPVVTTNGSILKQSHNYPIPGNYIVTLTSTNNSINPCNQNTTSVSQLTLHVVSSLSPTLSLVVSPAGVACQGTMLNFIATATNEGSNPIYQWKVNGMDVGTNSSTFSSKTLQNNDVVSCSLVSSLPCSTNEPVSSSLIVSISSQVSSTITISTPNSTICKGTSATYTAISYPSSPGSSYQWKVNGIDVGTNSSTMSYQPNNGDIVTCILTTTNGCNGINSFTSNAIIMTTVDSTPSVDITASANPICENSNVIFTATPTNGGASPTYQWKWNGSNVGDNHSTYSNRSLHNNDVISCVMTSNSGCATDKTVSSNSIIMQVNPIITPSITISAPTTNICQGNSIIFTASPVDAGSQPFYQWKLNGMDIGTNSPTFNSASLANGDKISCLMNSSSACAANPAISNSLTITVNPIIKPTISIAPSKNPICKGDDVAFSAHSVQAGSAPVYNWMINGDIVKTTANDFYHVSTLEDGDKVNCELISSQACATVAFAQDVTMKVYPLPTVVFNPSEIVIPYGTVYKLNPIISGNIRSYLWTPSIDLNSSVTRSPFTNTLENRDYKLEVTSFDNCSSSSTVSIIVFRDLIMPNAFTPNRDGINDIFQIPRVYQNITIKYFRMYNRYGQKVFETTNANQGWDGTLSGVPQGTGTFVWIIEYKNLITNKWEVLKGTSTLIR
ncbi:MAG: gliding motility-associated C-terminal domain-containing protein [Chitinophagaceae bacterium]